MLSFLQKVFKELDKDRSSEIVAFYTDFSNAFDKVPHFELLCKVAEIGVGGCILEVLINYLTNRKQFVRVENVCSQMKDVSSGVHQGSLLGPLLFCIFINNLHEAVIFSETHIFAGDLKALPTNRTPAQIQSDLHSIENLVSSNMMEFAWDKLAKITLKVEIITPSASSV